MLVLIEEKIREILDAKFLEEEYADYYLVDISHVNSKVEVFVDCDSGLSLKKCTTLSRFLESIIDENEWLGPKYTLEVSSPGLTRPLIPRQYQKNIGRQVKVKVGEETFEGKLEKVENEKIFVSFTTIEKIEKKKVKTDILKEINFADIIEIKIIISFS